MSLPHPGMSWPTTATTIVIPHQCRLTVDASHLSVALQVAIVRSIGLQLSCLSDSLFVASILTQSGHLQMSESSKSISIIDGDTLIRSMHIHLTKVSSILKSAFHRGDDCIAKARLSCRFHRPAYRPPEPVTSQFHFRSNTIPKHDDVRHKPQTSLDPTRCLSTA